LRFTKIRRIFAAQKLIEMQVDKQVIDQVNAIVKIQLVKADYQEKVEKTLKNYRKKANVPGFRPGMVPAGLINRMYGKAVLAEEVQNIVSEALFSYIKDNNINVLGEPLPSLEQSEINFDIQQDFEFSFDIAIAPELVFTMDKKDSVPYYTIDITDTMVDDQIKNLAGRNGSYEKAEKSEDRDVLKGSLKELNSQEEEISVEEAVLMPAYFKNEDEKAKLLGLAVGDSVVFNPSTAYDKSESELASLLKVSKEVAAKNTSDFVFVVKEITRYKEKEINQELFDLIYGKDVVNSEEEFREKVKESLVNQFAPESDYRFMVDSKDILVKKLKDVEFPVEFLKRWILTTKENQKAEEVEAEMPKMIEDLKWHLMKEKIVKENNLTVTDEDLLNTAKKITSAQFAQYGMMNVPEDLLSNYASDMLKKEESRTNIVDQTMSAAVAKWLKEVVKLNKKNISVEDFNKLYA
jgi:trigger factor